MSDTGEERNLPASARKLRDARRKGQVSRSQDLVSAAGLSAAIAYVGMRSELLADQWREILLLAQPACRTKPFPAPPASFFPPCSRCLRGPFCRSCSW